jgi:PAS domain S-box-containing protein
MTSKDNYLVRHIYGLVGVFFLVFLVIGGGLYFLERARSDIEEEISRYHLFSIIKIFQIKGDINEAYQLLEESNLHNNLTQLNQLNYSISEKVRSLNEKQELYNDFEFDFLANSLSEKIVVLVSLINQKRLQSNPLNKSISKIRLDLSNYSRLHFISQNKKLSELRKLNEEVYPILLGFSAIFFIVGCMFIVRNIIVVRTLIQEIRANKLNLEKAIDERTSELNNALLSIKKNKDYLSSIIASMADGLITITDKGIISEVNPEAERLFGYSSIELIGNNVSMLVPESDSSQHDQYIQNYLSTGIEKIIGIGREVDAMKKDGTLFPIHLGISKVTVGDEISFVGSIHDLTERVKIGKELLLSKEEAENANHAKSEFLSSMSHELRTPLNAILGFSQLLLMNPKLQTPTNLENIDRISSAGKHLLELINEILDLAQIESGQVSLSLEPMAIGELMDETMLLVNPLALERDITMSYIRNEFSDRFVMADRTRLKQVILNLISNAIKYNKEHGTVEIILEETPENRLQVSVIDTGHGIPEGKQKGLFEAFNRLGVNHAEIEGTGIGLSITKKLIELMNGSIDFDSTVGEGSCFYIAIPLCEAHQIEEKEVLEAKQVLLNTTSEPKYQKVLYVEDNPHNLDLVRQILKVRGDIDILTAPDARLGIDLAKVHQPDLILMDINLPGLNGMEAFKILKDNPKTSDIPVIAVSANAMEKDIAQGMAAGFMDYITKPINVPQFLEKINKVLK